MRTDGYWVFEAYRCNNRGKPQKDDGYDFFVGHINGELHLLGYRPKIAAYLFSERECSSLDLGTVELPRGKSLSDIVKGEKITIKENGCKPYKVEYKGKA